MLYEKYWEKGNNIILELIQKKISIGSKFPQTIKFIFTATMCCLVSLLVPKADL